ncbi:MAG: hypothetical protein EHM36_13855 [Deltaproteobacteria bacterium]|nr:MAG: hypothetical protein EHM36_13855 [Deltaproteobacteria bacterium]
MRISQAIIEIEDRLRHEKSLKKLLNRLAKDLSKDAKRKYFITIAPMTSPCLSLVVIYVFARPDRNTCRIRPAVP